MNFYSIRLTGVYRQGIAYLMSWSRGGGGGEQLGASTSQEYERKYERVHKMAPHCMVSRKTITKFQ